MKRKLFLVFMMTGLINLSFGQIKSAGLFSFGVRNTISLFNDGDWSSAGTGVGGQFRIQLNDKVNTEWFYDFISGNVGDFAHRTDQHIGWSVLFYPMKTKETVRLFEPYILAGHCFDYSLFTDNSNDNNYSRRWSSSVQGGIGTHINLTEKFNLSSAIQYMIHLGNDIHATNENDEVKFIKEDGVNLEGHILINISVNYKIGNLW